MFVCVVFSIYILSPMESWWKKSKLAQALTQQGKAAAAEMSAAGPAALLLALSQAGC